MCVSLLPFVFRYRESPLRFGRRPRPRKEGDTVPLSNLLRNRKILMPLRTRRLRSLLVWQKNRLQRKGNIPRLWPNPPLEPRKSNQEIVQKKRNKLRLWEKWFRIENKAGRKAKKLVLLQICQSRKTVQNHPWDLALNQKSFHSLLRKASLMTSSIDWKWLAKEM